MVTVSQPPLLRNPVPVAILAPVTAVFIFAGYPPGPAAVIAAGTALVVVILAAIDLERRIIPNRIVLPATAVVLLARIAFFPGHWFAFVGAALAASVALLVPNLINPSLMGMGDVKLALFLGAALGWGVVGAVTIAFLSLFPVALFILIRGGAAARKATLPFGPFLALGAIVILAAPRLIPGVGA
jgi:leader peptidase (prepilin peptidase) / N-methyltransferase